MGVGVCSNKFSIPKWSKGLLLVSPSKLQNRVPSFLVQDTFLFVVLRGNPIKSHNFVRVPFNQKTTVPPETRPVQLELWSRAPASTPS